MSVRVEHGWFTVYAGGEMVGRFRSMVRLMEYVGVMNMMEGRR